MPAHAAQAVIHGRVDRDGYTVEKVFLESFPGHFVTGNLYRPKGRSGRLPGVLCPARALGQRAFLRCRAKHLSGSRSPRGPNDSSSAGGIRFRPAACSWRGWAAWSFIYDMVGYADSVQIARRSSGVRPAHEHARRTGAISARRPRPACRRSWACKRTTRSVPWTGSLDCPTWIPGASPSRGPAAAARRHSSFAAIDPRPAVAFPGRDGLHGDAGRMHVRERQLLARGNGQHRDRRPDRPRPLGMTAADDWTKEIATKGCPS